LENPTSEILVFSFIGFKTVEHAVVQDQPVQDFAIDMVLDDVQLSEMIVVGVVVETHWYRPRRWWSGIKSLF
jgi:hypothetical protein